MRAILRSIVRSPLFALTQVMLLALSVAALLALATTAWSLLLKPLPFPHGDRLVEVRGWSSKMGFPLNFAPALAMDLRQMSAVERLGLYEVPVELEQHQAPPLRQVAMDPTSFELLGVTPALGRLPDPAAADEVVIAHSLWQSGFGGDPQIVGRRWELPAGTLRIVGVLPAGFAFPEAPVRVWRGLQVDPEWLAPAQIGRWGGYRSLLRLAPGQDAVALQAAVDARLQDEPAVVGLREHMGMAVQVEPLRSIWVGDRGQLLGLLAAAALLALLALLANLGSLWLGRCIQRQYEFGMRRVLGAVGWRALAPIYGEILLLTTAGVLGGLALTPLALHGLQTLQVIPVEAPLLPTVDAATGLLTVLSILALSALLALVPWWSSRSARSGDAGLPNALASGPRALGVSARLGRWRQGLLVTQLALAVTLLGASLLLLRSLLALLQVDTGFQARDLILLDVTPLQHPDEGVAAAPDARLQALVDAVAQLPQVRALSYASAPPLSGTEAVQLYFPGPEGLPQGARTRRIGPDYFPLLGQPLLAGRGFTDEDDPASTLMVDELFARRYLGGVDAALGQSINQSGPEAPPEMATVIGVVGNVKHGALDEVEPMGSVYHYAPTAQGGGMLAHFLLLQANGDPVGLRQPVEALAAAQGLRLQQFAPISHWIAQSTRERWPLLQLFGGFAATCLLLSLSGLVAQLHFLIQARRAELGLRAALGASGGRLLGGLLGEQLPILWLGLGLGLVGALICGRLLATQLHRIGPFDPLSLGGAVVVIALFCAFSAWLTARVGIRNEPMDALRTS